METNEISQGFEQIREDLEIARVFDAQEVKIPVASPYVSPPHVGFEERGTEQQLAQLYGALAAAQGEFEPINKTRTVQVKKEGKLLYTFDYAPMEELRRATVKALSRHGLVVMLPFGDAERNIVQWCIVAHRGGARLVWKYTFLPHADVKTFGGQLTYYQRYAYRSSLSLAADGDLDDMPEQSRGEETAEAGPRQRHGQQGRPMGSQDVQQEWDRQQSQRPRNQAPGPTRNGQPGQEETQKSEQPAQTQSSGSSSSTEQTAGDTPKSSNMAKASPQSLEEMRNLMRELGYNTPKSCAERIWKAHQGEHVIIGKQPFGCELTQLSVDLVMSDLLEEKAVSK